MEPTPDKGSTKAPLDRASFPLKKQDKKKKLMFYFFYIKDEKILSV